jgi:NitT/TauT family transport system substrate-binding protein
MRLKPGAKVLLILIVLFLLGFGAYKLGWLKPVIQTVAPAKKQYGKVEEGDFSFGKQGDEQKSASTDTTPAAAKPSAGKLNRPMRVCVNLWGGYTGGIVANGGLKANKNSVFFKDSGLLVDLVQIDDFQASRDAFRAGGEAGGVDILWSTVDAYAMEYGSLAALNPKAIMQFDWSRGGDAIAVGPGIKQASDLKGKSISLAEATPSHFFLLYVLAQAGLSQSDVKPVFTASAIEAAQVFKAGKTDACVSWDPDVYNAAKARQGAKILTSTREATSLIADIFVGRGDFLEQHPQEVTAFIAGWLKGVDMTHEDPETAVSILANSFDGISKDDARGMLADVKLPTAAEDRQFFGLEGSTLIGYNSLFGAASNIWKKVGYIEQATRPDITYDTSFLDTATRNWGGAQQVAVAPTKEFTFTPPATEVKKQEPIVTKRITIYFETGSSTLDPNAQMVLEQAAELAQTFGSAYLRVSGNTDNVGSHQMNVDLSRKRAQAVVEYLVGKYGFPRDKFIVQGNGPDKPVAGNDTDAGRAKNRRTDFEVVAQGQ